MSVLIGLRDKERARKNVDLKKKHTHTRFDWLPGELTPAANHSTRMTAQKEYDWVTPGWAPRGRKHGEVTGEEICCEISYHVPGAT